MGLWRNWSTVVSFFERSIENVATLFKGMGRAITAVFTGDFTGATEAGMSAFRALGRLLLDAVFAPIEDLIGIIASLDPTGFTDKFADGLASIKQQFQGFESATKSMAETTSKIEGTTVTTTLRALNDNDLEGSAGRKARRNRSVVTPPPAENIVCLDPMTDGRAANCTVNASSPSIDSPVVPPDVTLSPVVVPPPAVPSPIVNVAQSPMAASTILVGADNLQPLLERIAANKLSTADRIFALAEGLRIVMSGGEVSQIQDAGATVVTGGARVEEASRVARISKRKEVHRDVFKETVVEKAAAGGSVGEGKVVIGFRNAPSGMVTRKEGLNPNLARIESGYRVGGL